MQVAYRILVVLVVATAAACAVQFEQKTQLGTRQISPDMLLYSSPLADGTDISLLPPVNVIEVTPEMAAFLDREVGGLHSSVARLRQLARVVLDEEHFNLVYDDSTRTAAGTFEAGHGNCLSFTNLFIAMARYLGIQASYEEVETPPDWFLADETYLFSQHVNVRIDLGTDLIEVVDFYGYGSGAGEKRQIVSDERGLAHYFNNIGVDHMLDGDNADAFTNFRRSIDADDSFAPAWINLGILYRRAGLPAWAEAAYIKALDMEPSNMIAMSNLSNLYKEEGYAELAAFYDERVQAHRARNPYYRYRRAQTEVMDGDYASAIEDLEDAIHRLPDEPRFYSLLSVAYHMTGDSEQALRWMRKAESVAEQGVERQRYSQKVEWMKRQSGKN